MIIITFFLNLSSLTELNQPKNLSLNFKHIASYCYSSIFVLNFKVKIIWYFTSLFFYSFVQYPNPNSNNNPFSGFYLGKITNDLKMKKSDKTNNLNSQRKILREDFNKKVERQKWFGRECEFFSVFGQMLYIFAYWLILLRLCFLLSISLYKLARQ